jgi:peroxiredoxin
LIKPLTNSRIERNGIRPGTVAPEFALSEIRGGIVSLKEYRGRRVLLVFSDPHCGPCAQLAPDLVRAHRREGANGAAIVLVSRGDRKENQQKADEQGFKFPVVIQDRWKLSRQYGIFATPVAFLISPEGHIARAVAVGISQIQRLLYEELPPGLRDRVTEAAGNISGILARPISRRQAAREAGLLLASLVLGVLGMSKVGRAFACAPGETPCGIDCCEQGWRCCGGECCSSQLPCCNGTCCAPTEVCVEGRCRQQVLP